MSCASVLCFSCSSSRRVSMVPIREEFNTAAQLAGSPSPGVPGPGPSTVVVVRRRSPVLIGWGGGRVLRVGSRREMLAKSLTRCWRASSALWHMGLTKLCRFGRRPPRIQVFACIEAWRPVGLLTWWCSRALTSFCAIASSPGNASWNSIRACRAPIGSYIWELVRPPRKRAGACRPARSPDALALMRAEAYKGHHEIIAVWPQVVPRSPGATGSSATVICGQTWKLALLVAAAITSSFGGASRKQKDELLQRCRCLALPSRGEDRTCLFGSDALRRPCLVSQHDAGREVVHPPEAGWKSIQLIPLT